MYKYDHRLDYPPPVRPFILRIRVYIINNECVLVRSGPTELQQYQDESDAPGKHLRNDIKYYIL